MSLTAQQPYNNVVRTALQALAAVLGGTQSLHTNSLDEALALPTAEAATLALRTQQIIAHESGVADVVDPLGGSYFVETLTQRHGGGRLRATSTPSTAWAAWCAAIEQGYPQREIAESSYRFQQAVERKDKIIVGVNDFVMDDEPPIPDPVHRRVGRRHAARRGSSSCGRTRDGDRVQRGRSRRCARPRAGPANTMYAAARLRARLRDRRRDVRRPARRLGRVGRRAAII